MGDEGASTGSTDCPDAGQGNLDPVAFCRLLAENTRDIVLFCCPDLTIQWASPSLLPVLGIDPGDIVGTKERLVDAQDRARADLELQAAIAEHRDHVRGRLRVRHADGHVMWFDVSVVLVWSDAGDLRHGIVSMRDVTAEFETQRALAASEKRFRTAMADSAIGMALVSADGHFLAVNRALCDFFGFDEDALLTKSWRELTHPFDLGTDEAAYARLSAGESDRYRVTKRYLHADGSVLVGDLSLSAIRDDDGTLAHFVTQIVDVTEQARTQLELAQSEEHFRLLADNASDVVVRATNEGVLQWVSKSITRARGWAPEDLVGHAFVEFVHPDDVPTVQLVQQGVRTGQQGKFEVRIRSKDGDLRWFAITVSPIRGGNGVMTGRVASWRDVDQEVEARLLAAAREAEFRLLAEHASDLVVRIGRDDRVEWVSPSVTSVLGWLPDDLLGRPAREFLDPVDVPRYDESVADLRAREPSRHSGRIRCGDGTFRWFAGIATKIVDDEGANLGRIVGLRDIDADVRALEPLITSEAGLRAAMAAAPTGMAIVDLERRFVHVNEAFATLVGHDREWFRSHGIADVLPSDQDATDAAVREQLLAGELQSTVVERPILLADGTTRWVLHSIGLVRDETGQPRSFFSQFLDIDQARQARANLEFLATHDTLTRLPNRRALLARMETVLSRPTREDARTGVLFLDLDSLKSVNDRYGHLVGDTLLVTFGERVADALRDDDLVARLGGDEFVCVLESVRDLDDLATIAQKVHEAVAQPVTIRQHRFTVTTSIGATLAQPGDLAEDVIARADRALYDAKRAGGNRIDVHRG